MIKLRIATPGHTKRDLGPCRYVRSERCLHVGLSIEARAAALDGSCS